MGKRDFTSASQDLIGNLTRGNELTSKIPEIPKIDTVPADMSNTITDNATGEVENNAVGKTGDDASKKSYRKRKKPMERKFQIAMGEELYQELSAEADAEGMALNTYIRNLLTKRKISMKQLQNTYKAVIK